ncbi:GNAT family N-acetyltransferase [Halomicrobium salinisoli]|uniref:GNAT family N-acetyltransferase n=1 Tax=Halomicrobium salinisoli TaxID=2878391 RepID=UPI001CF030A2|nr:GNAT family N-acetyltransferase [Halomicrobium salinisoli]
MPTVTRLTTDAEWDAAVPILRQLWSHEDESFVRSWREEDDYRLYGYYAAEDELVDGPADPDAVAEGEPEPDAELVAVAGVSVQRVLHHRRHAWIHDLVVDEAHRNRGHGAALLAWIEAWARERDCEYVALACVAGNDEALAFYEDAGLETWGRVVERELD